VGRFLIHQGLLKLPPSCLNNENDIFWKMLVDELTEVRVSKNSSYMMHYEYLTYDSFLPKNSWNSPLCKRMINDEIFLQKHIDCTDESEKTLLVWACSATGNQPVENIQKLISHGADVNKADNFDNTALMYSAYSLINVNLLLEAGADVSLVNKNGATALSTAIHYEKFAVARRLLMAGSSVVLDNKNCEGMTPLMRASQFNLTQMIKLFIKYGAKLDIQNNEGNTALMVAADKQRIEAAKLLLESGADVHITNNKGQKALDFVYLLPHPFNAFETKRYTDEARAITALLRQYM
jgi:ankyrin repeat protein